MQTLPEDQSGGRVAGAAARPRRPARRREPRSRPPASWRAIALAARRSDPVALALLCGALGAVLLFIVALPPGRIAFAPASPPATARLAGFYDAEGGGAGAVRWAGPEASITLLVATPGRYRLAITAQDVPAATAGRVVKLRADGQDLGTLPLAPTPARQEFALTVERAWWLRSEAHAVALTLDTPAYRPAADPRALGPLITAVSLAPADGANAWPLDLLIAPLGALLVCYGAARLAAAGIATATGACAGMIVALGFVALGGRQGALAILLIPRLYPSAAAGVLGLVVAAALLLPLLRHRGDDSPAGARDAGAPGVARRWWPLRPETLLLFFLLLCYGFFFQAPNWNENSRFDLVRALVEQGTTSIDDYHANTEDKAFANGHYRSDKAPGSAILGTPVYAATRALGAVTGRDLPAPDRLLPAVALAVSGLPTLLAVLVLMRFLRPLVGASWALAGGAGYGLGTIAFPFATVFFGHAAAAGFLFAAFAILITVDPGGPRRRPLLAGFLCGWAVLIEFPAALAVAILLAYATWRDRRALLPLILGGLPLAVVLLIYNWRAFGNPLSVGYAHLIYEGFLAGQGQGFLGITFPSLESLRLLLIGQRGLLRLSPWLVAAPLGAWAWWRRGARAETLACAGICLAFLIYNAGYYSPLGGATPGPRFLVPALPFAALLAGLAPRRWWPFLGAQIGCAVLLIALATAIEPKAPEFLADPIGDVWVPRLLSDRFVETSAHAHWGLQGWEPLLLLVLGAALALGAALLGARVRGRAGRVGAACLVALLVLLLVASVPLDYRAAAPTPRSPQALRVAGG